MSIWLGQSLGQQIRLWRKRRGWTLKDLAAASGYSFSWISDIERGRTDPSLKSVERLAAALGAEIGFHLREAKE